MGENLHVVIASAAAFVTSTAGIVSWCVLILVIAMFSFARFRIRIAPLAKDLESANYLLRSLSSDMATFAVHFQELDEAILERSRLRHSWQEFTETLLFPGIEINDDENVIYNTHTADTYFSRDKVVNPLVNMRFYSSVPNMLTGLGILGTFVGLVCGIYLSTGGLASTEIEQAREALQTLLDGAAFAFTTSIVGLFTSIVFSWREKHWAHRVDLLLINWIDGIDARVLRLPPEKLQALSHRESKEQTKVFRSFTNDLAFSITKIMDDQVKQPLTDLMERLISAVDSLRSDRAETNEEVLKQLLSEFSSSITGAAGQEMHAFSQTLSELNETFSTKIGEMASGQQDLVERTQEALAGITKCVEDIVHVNLNTQESLRETARLVDLVQQTERRLIETISPLEGAATVFADASERTERATSATREACAQVERSIEGISSLQTEIRKAWTDYAERFENVDTSLASTFSQLDAGLTRYSESITNYVLDIEKQTQTVVRDLAGATKELSASVEELQETLSKANGPQ